MEPGPGPRPTMISEVNWEEKANKWRNGINVLTASNEDILDYVQTKT